MYKVRGSIDSIKRSVSRFRVPTLLEPLYNTLPLTCLILDESGMIISLNNWGVSRLGYMSICAIAQSLISSISRIW